LSDKILFYLIISCKFQRNFIYISTVLSCEVRRPPFAAKNYRAHSQYTKYRMGFDNKIKYPNHDLYYLAFIYLIFYAEFQ